MGKVKAKAANLDGKVASDGEPALIVFGKDEAGRSHASSFAAAEVQLAERAAGFMAMWVLPVTSAEHRAVAAELPAGKIFSSGKGFVPYVSAGTYARLEAFPEAYQPAPPAETEQPAHASVPTTWATIDVGSLVLAGEAPGHGYFEAVVTAAPGDDLFDLRWVYWPDLPPFVRRREHLALLCADPATFAEMAEEPVAEAAEAEAAEA